MVVSQLIFSGITLGPHVDQLPTRKLELVDSLLMTQLCRHYWEGKNIRQCEYVLATTTSIYQMGHHTVRLHLHTITCAADNKQNAIKQNLQAHTLHCGNTLRHSLVIRRSRPKHAVSEGLLTLAEDKKPEATLLIRLSQNAWQSHSRY